MTAATALQAPSMRLVPAPEPELPGTIDRLRFLVDRMEGRAMQRRSRRASVADVRQVLVEVQDITALCGLYLRPGHPMQQLVDLVVSAIDHDAGRKPWIDDTPQHRRRVRRLAAEMAAAGKGVR